MRRYALVAALHLWVAAGCQEAGEESAGSRAGAELSCTVVRSAAPLPAAIPEASGAAVSRNHPEVVWTHNDSGDGPVVYAVTTAGEERGAVRVAGAEATDWEDIALAPCAGGDCLYIADIGDNEAARESVVLYRIAEPAPTDSVTAGAARLELRYPDGPRDAETLFVLPGERLFLVTKGEGAAVELFAVEGGFDNGPAELRSVATLSAGPVELGDRVTGGDATVDGEWVVLRSYRDVIIYRAEELVAGEARPAGRFDISGLGEVQGEGVGWGHDGALVLVGEGGTRGAPGTVAALACDLP